MEIYSAKSFYIFKVPATEGSRAVFQIKIINMSAQFFSKLSQNFIELLEDDEYYDVTIEVGEDPNVKIFRTHMNVLCYRSPYLRRNLVLNKGNKDNVLTHFRLPNISPETFQIILR